MKKSSMKKILNGALVLFLTGAPVQKIFAHEAECPHCGLDIVQDTAEQDNETAIQYGKKRIEYRCILCAIADADKSYQGDLSISAPSEMKGKPVQVVRKGGQWSAPEGTIFLGQKVKHRYCQTGYRAFTSQAAFDAHVKKNKVIVGVAKPIVLTELVNLAHADTGPAKEHSNKEGHEGSHKE